MIESYKIILIRAVATILAITTAAATTTAAASTAKTTTATTTTIIINNKVLNTELSDMQWLQASLTVRDGGLGTRRVSMLASSAYLASTASTDSLVSAILCRTKWRDIHREEMLEARRDSMPAVVGPNLSRQKNWDRPLIDR